MRDNLTKFPVMTLFLSILLGLTDASLLHTKHLDVDISTSESLHGLFLNETMRASTGVTCRSADAIRYPRQWELKRTALVSYPRSGNSWTRNLLQKASGYLTSSIYHDLSLVKNMPGELFQDDKFLVKTHFPLFAESDGTYFNDLLTPSSQLKYYDQAVYLVRNPFDSILSYYQYQKNNNSHTVKMTILPYSLTIDLLEPFVQWYSIFFDYWEKVRLPFLVLKYEDLRANPAVSLEKLIDFLVPRPSSGYSPVGMPSYFIFLLLILVKNRISKVDRQQASQNTVRRG